MEEEAVKIRDMQAEVEKQMNMSSGSSNLQSPLNLSMEEKMEADNRSVYIGNVGLKRQNHSFFVENYFLCR